MFKHLKSRLRAFRRDEEGSIIAEVVTMAPTLVAAILATYVFFDAFRNQSVSLKANYTIADAVSRETDYIDETYIGNLWNLQRFLTTSRLLPRLRVSVIKYDSDTSSHTVVWSSTRGGGSQYSQFYEDVDISNIGLTSADIPVIPDNEVLIAVQTESAFEPQFSIGLEAFKFQNTTYTRPRFTSNLCYNATPSNDLTRICPYDS